MDSKQKNGLGSSEKIVPSSEDVSHAFTELTGIDCVDMSETSNTSSCIGVLTILGGCDCSFVMGAREISVITLKGLIGTFESLRLEG